jgi:deoxyribose-phosphate aldolase
MENNMIEKLLGLDPKTFGLYFDHTLLKAYASNIDFEAFCNDGIRCNVKMLAVNPAAVVFCKERVKDCDIHIGAAIGFPLGQSTVETKVFETGDAIKKGADEIDYVINIGELKNGNFRYLEDEMKAIVSVCRENGRVSKVIFENCYLTGDEKKALCDIANKVKPDFIKTSTGFGTGGAAAEDVRLMREYAEPSIKIKASGGIKTFDDTVEMIEAGAERIGTSGTVGIIEEFIRRRNLRRSKT